MGARRPLRPGRRAQPIADGDRASDDDQHGPPRAAAAERHEVGKRATRDPLAGKRAALDDRRRRVAGKTGVGQHPPDARELGARHEDHERVRALREVRQPIPHRPAGSRLPEVVGGHERG
jgi:hypothetical protein